MFRALAAVLLFLATFAAVTPAPAAPATPEEIRETLEAMRGERIQWVIPDGRRRAETEPERPGWLDLPILEMLLITIAGAAVIALALFVASFVRSRRRIQVAEPQRRDSAPAVRISTIPLELAELAAREGDYAEAIHLLLLGTIEEIRASLGYDAHPSLTSREIVRSAPLPPGGEPPLAGIVAEVERSHFGARPVTESDYRRCVEWHGELRRACAAGSAAS